MTLLEAMDERRSRRLYLNKSLEPATITLLNDLIQSYNSESGLAIRLLEDGGTAFNGFRKSYGLFSGVRSLIVLVGSKTESYIKEKAGFYGEKLVLEATRLGLGTCWVGGTFDLKNIHQLLDSNEELVCVIPVGEVESLSFKEKMVHQMVAGKSKSVEQLLRSEEKVPDWIIEGVRAVQKAPSAANRQPVRFSFINGILSVYTQAEGKFDLVDLGIAKAHFEVATGRRFELGNPAKCLI